MRLIRREGGQVCAVRAFHDVACFGILDQVGLAVLERHACWLILAVVVNEERCARAQEIRSLNVV